MPRKTQEKIKGRQPNYDMAVLNKTSGKKTYVGAGWLNDDGSISVYIDQCVVLTSDANLAVCLFPRDRADLSRPAEEVKHSG